MSDLMVKNILTGKYIVTLLLCINKKRVQRYICK